MTPDVLHGRTPPSAVRPVPCRSLQLDGIEVADNTVALSQVAGDREHYSDWHLV